MMYVLRIYALKLRKKSVNLQWNMVFFIFDTDQAKFYSVEASNSEHVYCKDL